MAFVTVLHISWHRSAGSECRHNSHQPPAGRCKVPAMARGPKGLPRPPPQLLRERHSEKARLERMGQRGRRSMPSLVARPVDLTSPDVVAALRRCVWTDSGDRPEGWSYLPGRDHKQSAVRVYATTRNGFAWESTVVQREDFEVNAFSSTAEDLSTTAWAATFTSTGLASVLKALPREARAQTVEFGVVIELEYGSERHRTPLTKRYRWGSAAGFLGGRSTPIPGSRRRGGRTLVWFCASEGPALSPRRSSSPARTSRCICAASVTLGRPGCRECRTVAASPCLIPESACKPFGSR